jgi:hypothetical protein
MRRAKSLQLTCFVEGKVVTIVTIGIDLAKNVLAGHGMDATGKAGKWGSDPGFPPLSRPPNIPNRASSVDGRLC